MKFSVNEFAIDKEYDNKLRNKIETFREETNTKKEIGHWQEDLVEKFRMDFGDSL